MRRAGRRGSVLILVVAVLVLLALMGTAYMITARNDRVASRLYQHNVQIDLLVEGVENMCWSVITNPSYLRAQPPGSASNAPGAYTSPAYFPGQQRYDDWTTDGASHLANSTTATLFTIDKTWLGARYPTTATEATGVLDAPYGAAGVPIYPVPKGAVVQYNGAYYLNNAENTLTSPASGSPWVPYTLPSGNATQPYWPAISAPLLANAYFEDPTGAVNPSGIRTLMAPTFTTINGVNQPALGYYNYTTAKVETAMGASASGDGIADSLLWRLPVGTIDGVTYYAAVRVIDNNSAINLNTANSAMADFDASGNFIAPGPLAANSGGIPGAFPSSIGLAEMALTYSGANASDQGMGAEIAAHNNTRFTGNYTTVGRPSGISGSGSSPLADPAPNSPPNTPPSARADFTYRSEGDALYMGLGRRPGNAGWSTGSQKFNALGWSESAALAYRFDLANGGASPSVSETNFVNSLYNSAATPGASNPTVDGTYFSSSPLDPSIATNWFTNGFLESTNGTSTTLKSRRGFFTTRNPLSNCMPAFNLTGLTFDLPAASQSTLSLVVAPNYNGGTSAKPAVPRVSLNTAPVWYAANSVQTPTLWQGFLETVLNAGTLAPAVNGSIQQGYGMFRSPIRDPKATDTATANPPTRQAFTNASYYFSHNQMLLLRSLLAALNAADLRDPDDNCTVTPQLPFGAVQSSAANTPVAVNVVAAGSEKQPFICEVYVNNDTSKQTATSDPAFKDLQNPNGYIAVKLFNPYDVPISMTNWALALMQRASTLAPQTPTILTPFSNNLVIGPHSYLVLENFATGNPATDATFRPFESYTGVAKLTGGTAVAIQPVANFHQVLIDPATGAPDELVILRPGPAYSTVVPQTTAYLNMIPVDNFDFTGMSLSAPTSPGPFNAWHYVRITSGTTTTPVPGQTWKFVYPGRWDPLKYGVYHQEGIDSTLSQTSGTTGWYNPATGNQTAQDPWIAKPPSGAAGNGVPLTCPIDLAGAMGDPFCTYVNNFPAIQINNVDFGGPNKLLSTSGTPVFPFGGFTRVGDVLQVPFIGAYVVYDSSGTKVIEMNSVTADCAQADDYDAGNVAGAAGTDDTIEQVGRFCPLRAVADATNAAEQTIVGPSFNSNGLVQTADSYGWANNILDYFTAIQNPNDDYLPNYNPPIGLNGSTPPANGGYFSHNPSATPPVDTSLTAPVSVQNLSKVSNNQPNEPNEDLAPIEGLLNVNTVNWRVLAAAPFGPPSAGDTTSVANAMNYQKYLAQSIVTFRNTYGPFKTLFDLNLVPANPNLGKPALASGTPSFQYSGGKSPVTSDYGYADGDLSPSTYINPSASNYQVNSVNTNFLASDFVTNDFETRLDMVTKMSNVLTTRSDTFTVYILVQGWTGIGTPTPSVVVQRRAAFLVDRSGITSPSSTLNITPVQTN